MERIVEKGILYDYYGGLLTERQSRIYEDAVYNDLSLSELAQEYGITRQGVHDLLKRCDKSLQEYEDKLGCVRRDQELKKLLTGILEKSGQKDAEGVKALAEEALRRLSQTE